MYNKYHEHGLEILAFPTNQFGGQEPAANKDIKAFAHKHYGVNFPMFEKVGRAACAACGLLGSARSRSVHVHITLQTRAHTQTHTHTPICAPSRQTDVNGPNAHPVYKWLKRELPAAAGGGGGSEAGHDLPWNFQKVRGMQSTSKCGAWHAVDIEVWCVACSRH